MARLLKVTSLAVLVLLSTLGCRKKEVPSARIAIENNYTAIRLLPFSVAAGVSAENYQWVIDSVSVKADDINTQLAKEAKAIRDSTVSRQEKLECTFYTEGTYFMRCLLALKEGQLEKSFCVHVVTEFQSYKPYAKLVDYRPALGNKVRIEARNANCKLATAMARVNRNLSKKPNSNVYLGSFGGHATFEFDHAVRNLKGKYDFQVKRDTTNRDNGRADVVVWVSQDNEKWFRLQSRYDSIALSGSYANGLNGQASDKLTGFASDDKYLFKATTGEIKIPVKEKETELVPVWIEKDFLTYTYEGFLLKKQAWDRPTKDLDGHVNGYEMYKFNSRQYNTPPEGEEANFFGMDIDWAVDESGNRVSLPTIKYVKVATGVLEVPKKWRLLESSVSLVEDLNLK